MAGLTFLLACAIADEAIGIGEWARRLEVRLESRRRLLPGADIAVVFVVIYEGGALKGVVASSRLVEHGDIRLDALILDQPGEVRRRAVGGVRHQFLGPETEALLRPLKHPALCGHLSLPHRSRRFNVDDHRVIEIDQIVATVQVLEQCLLHHRPLAHH